VFAQVLGELEKISRQLVPAALDGRSAAGLFNDATRAERLCRAIKSRLARRRPARRRRSDPAPQPVAALLTPSPA